jgi:AraC-like DNA-binding protein
VHYREVPPRPALRPYVERFWFLEGPAGAIATGPIPPDGRAEIVVHAGDPFAARDAGGAPRVQDRVLLAGQATRAVDLVPRGYARIVGARLRPAGARALLSVPQHELTDRIVSLQTVQPRLARALRDDVASRQEPDGLVAALERAIGRHLVPADRPSPATLAVSLALARRGLVRVRDLAAAGGVGARQLERLFLDRVGIPPKLFLRIVRFQEVLAALRDRRASPDWARLAVEHGFYDQAHFIHDFRAFTGATPGAWEVSDESLTAIFSALGRP